MLSSPDNGSGGIWPGGAEGAVSLTFDDAVPSQLARGVPILERHGLRGTFYVNPSDAWMAIADPWAEAGARGHEIGNHSLTHPCSENFGFIAAGRGLESLGLEAIESDLVEAERRLRQVIPGDPERTFCYPCYQTFVGRGVERKSYVPVVARHFVAARAGGEAANHACHSDPHCLGSWPCERRSGAEMIGMCEMAASQGRWAILTFHGVQEGHLTVAEGDFAELCRHLERHRDRIATAPVLTLARWMIEARRTGA